MTAHVERSVPPSALMCWIVKAMRRVVARAGVEGFAPSFSEEKEAKRLLILCRRGLTARLTGQIEKVFWFFFPKKNKDASQQ
ncbi:hypothetical protein [Acidomonas methanolica]|uniref:hypothetical protein n=1 Tax=Acidomonas methanolica TaxID=437 RepID=UPI000AD54660|nr:hypothetical protein [Acidomonas methanolica]